MDIMAPFTPIVRFSSLGSRHCAKKMEPLHTSGQQWVCLSPHPYYLMCIHHNLLEGMLWLTSLDIKMSNILEKLQRTHCRGNVRTVYSRTRHDFAPDCVGLRCVHVCSFMKLNHKGWSCQSPHQPYLFIYNQITPIKCKFIVRKITEGNIKVNWTCKKWQNTIPENNLWNCNLKWKFCSVFIQ